MGHGVADAGHADVFDGGRDVADFAGLERFRVLHFGAVNTDALHVEAAAGLHEEDLIALAQGAVEDAHLDDDALVGVVPGVEEQGFQRRFRVAFGRRDVRHHALQHLGHVDPGFRADGHGIARVEPDHFLDLLLDAIDIGGGQVDFVDDRHDFEIVIEGQVDVGQGLRLDALRGVHDQQRALAGGQAA